MAAQQSRSADAPPGGLQFVNLGANVTEEDRKQHQRLIRSAAMKKFRDEQKKSKSKDQAPKVQEAKSVVGKEHIFLVEKAKPGRSRNPQKDDAHVSPTYVQEDIHSSNVSRSTDSASPTLVHPVAEPKTETGEIVPGLNKDDEGSKAENSVITSKELINFLGAGRSDPFYAFPGGASPDAGYLIDHSLKFLWPGLQPDNSHFSLAASWLRKTRERPLVMHAMLYGALVHIDAVKHRYSNINNPARIHHKLRTIELLRQELSTPISEQTPLDEILLGVLTLGTSDVESIDMRNVALKNPFNSPLKSMQWMDVYGGMLHIKEHTFAMRTLIIKRGGLENIQLAGLAEILSYSDILGATQNLDHPKTPLLKRTLASANSLSTIKLSLRSQNRTLGQAFPKIGADLLTESAIHVYQSLADVTRMIKSDSHRFTPEQCKLIDRRNVVQHRLMSLPKSDELKENLVPYPTLYEGSRWAAIIYSVAVTFPMPAVSGIFPRLARNLQSALEKFLPFDDGKNQHQGLLLWILMLGAMTATETEFRAWYIDQLKVIVKKLDLASWKDAKEILKTFLWLDSACEHAGQQVWDEVTTIDTCQDESTTT